jgi:hypothetical protein
MPKYQLIDTHGFHPASFMPDLRGKPKAEIKRAANSLESVWNLPEPVAVRALLRISQVGACPYTGSVTIDDDVVVLWPATTTMRCTMERIAITEEAPSL